MVEFLFNFPRLTNISFVFFFQKLNLSSTLRRIGEELYRSYENKHQPESYKSLALVSSSSAGTTTGLNQKTTSQGLASVTGASPQTCLFSLCLQSENPHARLLSCLIILRTLTQGNKQYLRAFSESENKLVGSIIVDYIVNVFDVLRQDLRNELARRHFLYYHGTWTILKWFKSANKVTRLTST